MGARAAERAALDLAGAGATLSQLVVVPEFWKGMMGDDWLNNASTRDVYARHVESQLLLEIEQEVARIRTEAAARGLHYRREIVLGRPAQCLVECAARLQPDVVVIGAPRPPRAKGLRSRMDPDTLLRGLAVPLWVIPYPR